MAYARIYGMLQAQAAWLAYIDTIWIYGLGCLAVVPLAFFMRRPKRGSGAGSRERISRVPDIRIS